MSEKKKKNQKNNYKEFPERSGLSGLKGRPHNPVLGLRNERISCLTSQEGKANLEKYAEETELTQGEFILRLLLSKEAENFAKRLSVK